MTTKQTPKEHIAKTTNPLERDELTKKHNITEDVLTQIYSYLFILESVMHDELYTAELKITHFRLLVDKMFECVKSLDKYYSCIKYFNEIEEEERQKLIQEIEAQGKSHNCIAYLSIGMTDLLIQTTK